MQGLTSSVVIGKAPDKTVGEVSELPLIRRGSSRWSYIVHESNVIVAVEREQFGNPGTRRPPLKAGTIGLVKESRPRRLGSCLVSCRL
jgi:hypothetical protein